MSITEIVLLILGILIFIISFFVPAGGRKQQETVRIDEGQLKELIDKEVEEAKSKIGDIVEETITYSMEKTERSMDRLTNEKMMAVNEYSDTVLEQINKNHEEAVFLYDMLNNKHENLKQVVSEAVKTATEVKQTVKDAEITAKEAEVKAREVKESLSTVKIPEPVKKPVKAEPAKEEKTGPETPEEEEFTPIKPLKVELIKPLEEEKALEEEKPAETNKPRKRTAKKQKEEAADQTGHGKKAEKVELSVTASEEPGRNNNERILELHKAGKSNMAIAKELSLGIGEVKLVIDLFEGI